MIPKKEYKKPEIVGVDIDGMMCLQLGSDENPPISDIESVSNTDYSVMKTLDNDSALQ